VVGGPVADEGALYVVFLTGQHNGSATSTSLRIVAESALPDPSTQFGKRVRRRLREEQVIWITSVGRDGTPQPNPVGFLFQDDDSILINNMANANRLTHVSERPQVALHFDGDGTGGDIVVFTGTGRRADEIPPAHENQAFLAKYANRLLRVSDTAEEFSKRFPVPLRVEITRTRGL
jgi:PPOX class probable F420-dependent enzyme